MVPLSLTQKTSLFIVIALAIIITLRVGSTRLIILKDFGALEANLTRQNMERLFSAVDRECEAMVQILRDWCAWNDTLNFIRGTKPDYIEANLSVETFASLDLHLMVLADLDGQHRWTGVYSPDEGALAIPAPDMLRYLDGNSSLWTHADTASRRAGLQITPMGLMLMASGPIVNSEGKGPIAGTLIMGRRFGPAAVAAIEARMQMPVTIKPLKDKEAPLIVGPQQLTHLIHGPITLTPMDDEALRASAVIADMAGHPAATISIETPRNVTAQGRRTIRLFLFWQAVGGVLVTLMVIAFVRCVILTPITRLNREVTQIATDSAFSRRLEIKARDEVGQTRMAVNQMLNSLEVANTGVQAAYDELQKTQTKLVQSAKLASIGELAAGMAHELNQPLTVIRGTTQMLRRGLDADKLEKAIVGPQLALIEKNTKRMMNIIEQLRTFSSQSSQEKSWTDINKAIKGCLIILGEQMRVNDIAVEVDLAKALPEVWCDRNQIEQVFLSLITNAFDAVLEKADPSESVHGGVLSLSTRQSPGPPVQVEIRVRDNGIGIREDRLDWIFDPFFTTKEVGKGSGLGLSISYGIIQDHQGDLRVEETGPAGTTFLIRLPVISPPTSDDGGRPIVNRAD
jgi:signal transduction histidine kinase